MNNQSTPPSDCNSINPASVCLCISAFLSQQSQFVLHHQVWITHHFTLSWICKVIEQNKCQNLYSDRCLGDRGDQIPTI